MSPEILLGPITLRWYGIFVATGIGVAAWLAWRALRGSTTKPVDWFWDVLSVGIVSGLLGARAWHVATDWELYVDSPVRALAIWQGGLSILGGILGGVLGIYIVWQKKSEWRGVTFAALLDSLALGAPVGQAIGRLGNWVNQELYGLPTDLPWGILIEPARRVTEYRATEYFHPLFAYEALLLLSFAGVAWLALKRRWLRIGSGDFILAYLGWYGLVRFVLEFLRIEKRLLIGEIGVNQAIMGVLAVVVVGYYFWRYHANNEMSYERFD